MPYEQRQHPRVPITYRVKVVTSDRIIAFPRAINLSMGGILIGGSDRLPVGTSCGVAILLEESEAGRRVVTRGTVVRSDAAGMAIQFSRELEPGGVEALKALIQSAALETDRAEG